MGFPLAAIKHLTRIILLALLVPAVAFALQARDNRSGIEDLRRSSEHARGTERVRPCGVWIDLFLGEQVSLEKMVSDLMNADVVYLGETHTINRHHSLQEMLVASLCGDKRPVVVAMEQLEGKHQPELDRFNRGEISFDELAARINWDKSWSNFRDYRAVLEIARSRGAAVIGMNAPAAVVKLVARKGLGALSVHERSLLPPDIDTGAGHYRTLLNRLLMVHAVMSPKHLDRLFEAQVSRDEAMASVISRHLSERHAKRVRVIAIGGSMHFSWGLGVPSRVRRRVPGIKERIVIFSESGELELSPMESAMAGKVTITHQDLKNIPYPLADYAHILCRGEQ